MEKRAGGIRSLVGIWMECEERQITLGGVLATTCKCASMELESMRVTLVMDPSNTE